MCLGRFENGFRIFTDQKSARTFRNGKTVSEWRVAHMIILMEYKEIDKISLKTYIFIV